MKKQLTRRQRLEKILFRINAFYSLRAREGRAPIHLTNRVRRLSRAWLDTADYNQES